MKKVLCIILIAIIIVNVHLVGTKDVSKKNTFSFGLLLAAADGSDGENDPWVPPFEPIPDREFPDSTIIYRIP